MEAKSRSAKVMLLGDIGVGKTSLARRLIFDRFDGDYKTTIGVDILTYDMRLPPACGDETMKLVLWDTDGDFGEAIFSTMYLNGAAGAIIVADATRPDSFARMSALATGLELHLPGRPVKGLINKIDLVDQAIALPPLRPLRHDQLGRTSALTGVGVREMFGDLAETIWRRGT